MKYCSLALILFLAACHCDNETMELKGKVLSTIDSLPLSNYSLHINYSHHVKGELSSCGLNFLDKGLHTNSTGDFSMELSVDSKASHIKINGQHNELLYDSTIHDQVIVYATP